MDGISQTTRVLRNTIEIDDRLLRSLLHQLSTRSYWQVAADFQSDSRFDEAIEWLKSHGLNRGLSKRIKTQGLKQKIEKYLSEILTNIGLIENYHNVQIPRLLAFWAIASDGQPLPARIIKDTVSSRNYRADCALTSRLIPMIRYRKRKHFGRLIRVTNQSKELVTPGSFNRLLKLMENGASDKDVLFVLEQFCPFSVNSKVDVSKLRRCGEHYKRIFKAGDFVEFEESIGSARSSLQLDAFTIVFRWLEKFPAKMLDQKTKKGVHSLLEDVSQLLRFDVASKELQQDIQDWSSRVNCIAESFPNEVTYPKQLRIWLRKLGYYQNLLGEHRRIPKSLKSGLHFDLKRDRELAYLKQRFRSGKASLPEQNRYKHLSKTQKDLPKSKEKLMRDTIQACLKTGLQALRNQLVKRASLSWIQLTGESMPEKWPPSRVVEIAGWISRMSGRERRLLARIADAFQTRKEDYKLAFDFNLVWIAQQNGKGYRMDEWLNPRMQLIEVEGKRYKIEVCRDPYEVFMMGNYFDTCLSQDGCNEMSVLANAVQANKQVVYVYDRTGKVVSRMLLAINKFNEMVRYNCYCQLEKDARSKLIDGVMSYCKKIASKAGYRLGVKKGPASLGNFFWYNDGEHKWPESKKKTVQNPSSHVVASAACDILEVKAGFTTQTVDFAQKWPEIVVFADTESRDCSYQVACWSNWQI